MNFFVAREEMCANIAGGCHSEEIHKAAMVAVEPRARVHCPQHRYGCEVGVHRAKDPVHAVSCPTPSNFVKGIVWTESQNPDPATIEIQCARCSINFTFSMPAPANHYVAVPSTQP